MQVGKSVGLHKTIMGNIDKMFQDRLAFAQNWANYGTTQQEFDRLCFNSVCPETHQEFMRKLGKRYFEQPDTLIVKILEERYTIKFGEARLIPSTWTNHWNPQEVKDDAVLDIARRRKEAIKLVAKQRDDFKTLFQTIWDKAPSVNAIDKNWPAIRDLLPADAIQRLDTKVERVKYEKDALTELKELSVHMLKAKVAA